jgi:hypothetical protein
MPILRVIQTVWSEIRDPDLILPRSFRVHPTRIQWHRIIWPKHYWCYDPNRRSLIQWPETFPPTPIRPRRRTGLPAAVPSPAVLDSAILAPFTNWTRATALLYHGGTGEDVLTVNWQGEEVSLQWSKASQRRRAPLNAVVDDVGHCCAPRFGWWSPVACAKSPRVQQPSLPLGTTHGSSLPTVWRWWRQKSQGSRSRVHARWRRKHTTRFYAPPQVGSGARDAVMQASLSPGKSARLLGRRSTVPFPSVAHTSEADISVSRARECWRAGPSASEKVCRVNGNWTEVASLGPSARKPYSFILFYFSFLFSFYSNFKSIPSLNFQTWWQVYSQITYSIWTYQYRIYLFMNLFCIL